MAEKKKVKVVDKEKEDTTLTKVKPQLTKEVKDCLEIRSMRKKAQPHFKRQEWFRYKKLGVSWRKPRGLHSAMRRNYKYRPPMARIGFGGPTITRGLHPSGFREVMVYNTKDLEKIDPKVDAARIGHGVGTRKRIAIVEEARKKKIRVLNGGI
ncbi:MAG: 50S ribosomal protein L32e [Candidatus Thermoplasmatota archaeon]|nr:50S ribosomal protein L32e [Candidatus Thermoplasmatota archaeon]